MLFQHGLSRAGLETYLVTSCTAGLELFRIVTLAVELVVVNTVGEVHEQLIA